jgi:hypothetical protein
MTHHRRLAQRRSPAGTSGDDEGPSNIQVLLSLVGVALTLIGGYFLVMKLINMFAPGRLYFGQGQKSHPVELPRQTD